MTSQSGSFVARVVVVGVFLSVAALVGACGPGDSPDAAAPVDATAPADCSSGDAAAGRVAVGMRACSSCHAADLGGATTGTPGPNLTPTNLGGWSDQQLTSAILDGVDDDGGRLCTSMTRFRIARMSGTEVCNIVAHLRSLDPIARDIPDTCM
jgi:hypothetical protein